MRDWTIALTEYVFTAVAIFLISDRDGACPRYYTINNWVNTLSEGVSLRLSHKTLDTLKYFGLFRFPLLMDTNSSWTALAIHQCSKIGRMKTAVQDKFLSNDFRNGAVFDLEKDAVVASKCPCRATAT